MSAGAFSASLPSVVDMESNNTLDQAQALPDLARGVQVLGTIGQGGSQSTDVDWYRFTLSAAARVNLQLYRQDNHFSGILSLYNSDPGDFGDLYNPLGYRQLAQQYGATGGTAPSMIESLSAGTYFVAVSGSGNADFHPFIADSGYPGVTGDYRLVITSEALARGAQDGPQVLSMSPAAGTDLVSSPLVIRIGLDGPLDPVTLIPGSTVRLTYNATGNFGSAGDVPVPLAWVNFSAQADELQLAPLAALAPGHYQVFLAGNNSSGQAVVASPDGTCLGKGPNSPHGRDFSAVFTVSGIEGNTVQVGADDTPGSAHWLGDLTDRYLLGINGAIGDDPAYSPLNSDPLLSNPAAQVDLYHFVITGPGQHSFIAEAFAGRIGSPLDPALSLFQRDGSTGALRLIAANDNTFNDTPATNGSTPPLLNDAALYVGLLEGDYFLAVSGTGNVPDPVLGPAPGQAGIFDPNISHSGMGGFTTGPYVLNLQVQSDNVAPQVKQVTSLKENGQLTAPLTTFVVQFSKPVNLNQVAFQTYLQNSQQELAAVFFRALDGSEIHPRLVSYDDNTFQATFLMLDNLPNGAEELHLSGAGVLGITDLAGNPLQGNDASGDYVIHFTVNLPARGTAGAPRWLSQANNDDLAHAQEIGPLFPHELQNGVILQRVSQLHSTPPPADQADYFRFEVLQSREYILSVWGSGLAANTKPEIFDAGGNPVAAVPQGGGGAVRVDLTAGAYVVRIGGWPARRAPAVAYQLRISTGFSGDNPTPLTVGPSPAIRLRLVEATTPPSSPPDAPPTTGLTVPPETAGRGPSQAGGPDLSSLSSSQPVFSLLAREPLLPRVADQALTLVVAREPSARESVERLVIQSGGRSIIELLFLTQGDGALLDLPQQQETLNQPAPATSRERTFESWKNVLELFFSGFTSIVPSIIIPLQAPQHPGWQEDTDREPESTMEPRFGLFESDAGLDGSCWGWLGVLALGPFILPERQQPDDPETKQQTRSFSRCIPSL